jgi:membrane-associated HD superfamily phosphohydrolase
MAFWMDPLLLLGLGALIAWVAKVRFDGSAYAIYALELLAMAATYAISIGLFLNLRAVRPLAALLGVESGTAFMINGYVLGLVDPATTWTQLDTSAMFVAILLFAAYPLWLRLGLVLGRLLVGRNPKQEGLLGMVQP